MKKYETTKFYELSEVDKKRFIYIDMNSYLMKKIDSSRHRRIQNKINKAIDDNLLNLYLKY